MQLLVVTLSVGAALAFSVSTTLKKASAGQVAPAPARSTGTPRLWRFARETVRHPLWLAGVVADVVGLSMQVIALHLGALALVQPLLVSGLLFALLLRHLQVRRVQRGEIGWAVVLSACLIGLLVLSGSLSGGQHPATADRLPAVIAALAGAATAGGCILLARRRVPPSSRAALLGIAVGAIYAATAALIKSTTNIVSQDGLPACLISWQLYTTIALGAFGLFLTQLAFQAGPLTASLPAISTVDPLLSIAIGVLVYDEHLNRGPASGLALLALMLLLAVSVVQLGRVETAEATATV